MEDFFRVTHEIKLTVPQVDCGTHRAQRVMRVQVGHLGEEAVGQSWPQVQRPQEWGLAEGEKMASKKCVPCSASITCGMCQR